MFIYCMWNKWNAADEKVGGKQLTKSTNVDQEFHHLHSKNLVNPINGGIDWVSIGEVHKFD